MPNPWRSVNIVIPQYDQQSWRSVNELTLRHGSGHVEEPSPAYRSMATAALRHAATYTAQ